MADRFYKLPALAAAGIHIHLHCFGDDAAPLPPCLTQYCASVHVYPHSRISAATILQLPCMVASRKNEQLFQRLLHDDYPVLMEGIHCTALLLDDRFAGRRCFVRLQQVQHRSYQQQARQSANLLRKWYYRHQASLLLQHEQRIAGKAVFITSLDADADFYREYMQYRHTAVLPLFIPQQQVNSEEGSGSYCLYHGDLSAGHNEQAASWLLNQVCRNIDVPLVIAGCNPSPRLQQQARQWTNTCVVANPSAPELQDIIRKAHIHLLPSFTNTGVPGKLLNALFNGRHCIAHAPVLRSTGLSAICHAAGVTAQWIQQISALYRQPFTLRDITLRKQVLLQRYNNAGNAATFIQWIWER
ncbi:glycosyltransferase [Deminuibacter soli]|uniref:Glycosyltransferase n=2 Tax=Deminuibacter soli TaxID=2291815 RepID=A0A3E1NH67_9BACT|nr:glycosyltransferase [Deminuibacter soli]